MAKVALPKTVWSTHGPVPVRTVKKPDSDCFGMWEPNAREIEVEVSGNVANHLPTLFHEMTHVALWDSGAHNVLSKEQLEAVCDAIGAYFAGSCRAGYLTLNK